MDPISAAGIALSVASLAFQAFQGCIQGYQFLQTAKGMPEGLRAHMLSLEIQEDRLISWSEVVGLTDQSGPTHHGRLRMNPRLFIEVLCEIRFVLEQFGRAPSKDSSSRVQRTALVPGSIRRTNPDVGDRADPESQLRRGWRAATKRQWLNAVQSTSTVPRQLKWAMVDQKEFDRLLSRLTQLNDVMWHFMTDTQLREVQGLQEQTLMEMLQLSQSVKEIRQLVRSLHLGLLPAPGEMENPALLHAPYTVRDWQRKEQEKIAELAKFKLLNLHVDNEAERARTLLRRDRITFDMGQHGPSDERRTEAMYKEDDGSERHVWIEWKEYQGSAGHREPHADLVSERVQHLVGLLQHEKPDSFHAPHCLGYFIDCDVGYGEGARRFGFVFDKPRDVDPRTAPLSLLDLLQTEKPSLTARMRLAKTVANCILYLHSVNWLHKGLRSHNIVFYHPSINDPYLSGFDYARPAQREDLTERPPENPVFDVYRHPDALGDPREDGSRNAFRKSYDIYSLGIVLLEIATWRRIDHIMGLPDLARAKPPQTKAIRRQLLSEPHHLSQVEADAGRIFRDVVHVCLQAAEGLGIGPTPDETTKEVAADLQEAFIKRVVEPLNGLNL
ncbi:MAG: hypothetical protein M1838_004396 [Thelocarpon superellum]|nr:MAG: hypothetical protein M1838_004396 [Thelocarpon superellum]